MLKKTTTSIIARAISQGLKGIEKKVVESFRGISGLLESHRDEMHGRFDRMEKTIQSGRKRRRPRSKVKKK